MPPKSTTTSASTKKPSSKVSSSAKKTKALISKVDAAQPTPPRSNKVSAKETVVLAEKPTKKAGVEGGKKKKAVVVPAPKEGDSDEEMDELAGEESAATSKQEKLTAKAKKQQAVAEEDEEETDSSDEDEDAAYLHGFSDDGADSSDEEEDDVENIKGMVLDITKLPTIAKDDETVKRKLDRAKKLTKPGEYKGVICIGRLPHGFYEDQLRAYFSQFGEVSRLRVSRNKKTGASKHYAFLEFESVPVATIVAETMNNYLIHGHILKCELLPKEKVHPDLWIGANRKWRKVPMDRVRREEHNRPRTEDEREKASSRLLKRQAQKKRKLEDSGIKYDFDAVAYKKPKAVAAV